MDYQRAVEALEAAIRSVEQTRTGVGTTDHEVRRAEENVESARRRVAEIEAALERQFDRFCGVST